MPDAYFIASIKAKDFSPEVGSFTNHRTGNQSDFRRNSDFMKKILVRQPFFPIICRSLLIQVKFRKYTYLQSRFLLVGAIISCKANPCGGSKKPKRNNG